MSDSEQIEQLEILIKPSRGEKKTVNVASSIKVLELKETLASLYDIPATNQRLIYSGRILKDNDALEIYNIKNGHALHLVRGGAKTGTSPAPAASQSAGDSSSAASAGGGGAAAGTPAGVPTSLAAGSGTGNVLSDLTGARYAGFANLPSASMFGPDGGMGPAPDADQLLSMMEQPGFSEAMQQLLSDPDALSQMNPMLETMPPAQAQQFREFLRTPEFRQLMSDPQALRQMFQQAQLLRSYFGSGNAGAGSMGGFPMPGSGQQTTDESRSGAGTNGAPSANPFMSLWGGGAGAANSGGQMPDLASLLGSGAFGGAGGANFGAPAQPEDSRPPEERYERQLSQLNELGFYDFDRNVRALRRSGGNVEGAIDALLDGNF